MSDYPLLHHYTPRPIHAVGTVSPRWACASVQGFFSKPFGLWVSDDNDYGWAQWCADEQFGGLNDYRYTVLVHEPHKLLWLTSADAVCSFAEEYGIVPEWVKARERRMPKHLREREEYWRQPDWERVAQRWPGVIITPYQWPLRLADGFMWYYGWDCASGIIWDASIVSGLIPAPAIHAHHWGPRRLPHVTEGDA